MNRLNDPYEQTPEAFHMRIEQTLGNLKQAEPTTRGARRLALAATATALLLGTALALENYGVLRFFTERYERPIDSKTIAQPVAQSCDSKLLDAFVRDAYWDGEKLAISMSVKPLNADTALYIETDVGADGESFDKIWWKGEILSFDEWRGGRTAIELGLPYVTADVPCELLSWDWVQDEVGETLLIELYAEDMTRGATLTARLCSSVIDSGETETATLTAALPAMRKGDVSE